ncbi:MAG: extracellular solute-binding protein [Ruminococcaceae bacterium]|nr:extracellular solute-binding protein [Oscillospiraceae bacterium]
MKKTNFQRLTASLLCLMFVLGCFTLPFSAAGAGLSGSTASSTSNNDIIAEMVELLDALSYEEYAAANAHVPGYKGEIIKIDAVEALNTELTKEGDYKIEIIDGQEAVSTFNTGSVSWNIEIPNDPDVADEDEVAKYIIKIEYYAKVDEKAADIERILKINGKTPFLEARYLSLPKTWKNNYVDAIYTGKESLSTVEAAAKKAEMECYKEGGKLKFKYPEVWTQAKSEFCDTYEIRFMKIDIHKNELRPEAYEAPEWTTYTVRDSSGYTYKTDVNGNGSFKDSVDIESNEFAFVFEPGTSVLTLESENEAAAIKAIYLCPVKALPTYSEYMKDYAGVKDGKDVVKLEGEYTATATDKTIYAVEDRSSAVNSPCAADRTLLNTFGAEKWQTVGQAVTYTFSVNSSGMYDIITRFRQNVLDGVFVNRALYVYSDSSLKEGDRGYYNGIPFQEASALIYNYSDEWQTTTMKALDANNKSKEFELYFEAGVTYTLKFEVTLGKMGEIISDVQNALDAINNDYLTILRLTGTTPDKNRDYKFSTVMPDQLADMVRQSKVLNNDDPDKPGVAQKLTSLAGQKSSHVGTLQKVADLLYEMATNEEEIARNLARLKSYIGTLGTFLSDIKTQPLQVDYIMIQPDSAEAPVAKAGFWKTLWHEIKSFFWSFFRDYDGMGVMDESTVGKGVEVWLASGRDQSQVIRTLVNNDFTPSSKANGDAVDGSPVDLKLVAVGTLLPSILAKEGPDVYLGLAQADVINYAIRSAVLPIEGMDGFDEHMTNFTDAAKLVVGIEDANGVQHYYGIPEAQGFTMMFVRKDILADLGLGIPQTWDDIMAAVPVLQSKNMEIGLTPDFQIHLYQNGGELFADNGMRINLDSKVARDAFEKTCNFFTQYGFPYVYDAANRFRTGEMPIVVSDYTGLYNQLKVFATEIEGLWAFVPMPGTIQKDADGNVIRDENGEPVINNCAISSITATVMVKGCEDKARAWEFMKWYTGADCQKDYSNEMVAIMGPSAKYNTANKTALEDLPWTADELTQISTQFKNLAAVPNYPGAYIIARYTNFAFLAAYNNNEDPVDALDGYIHTINKEITRKREEFGLETLENGQILKDKRRDQAYDAIEALNKMGETALAKQAQDALKSGEDAVILSTSLEMAGKIGLGSSDLDKYRLKNTEIDDLSKNELIKYLSKALYDVSKSQGRD